MELNVKYILSAGIAILAVGFLSGRYSTPTKTVIKVEEKIVTREVVKYKESKSRDEDRNKETVIIETILPDGTKKVEKRIVDKSKIETASNKEGSKDSSTEISKKTEETVTHQNNEWNVALLAGVNTQDDLLKKEIGYGLLVQRRIIGPFYLGGFGVGLGSSSQTYGFSLGGSF